MSFEITYAECRSLLSAADKSQNYRFAFDHIACFGDGSVGATDGKRMVILPPTDYRKDMHPIEEGADPYLIPIREFREAAKMLRKRKEADTLTVWPGDHVLNAGGAQFRFTPGSGKFPDVGSALPKGDPTETVKLNGEFLASLAKSLGALTDERGGLYPSVDLEFRGPGLPVILRSGESKALLMPISVGGDS